MMILHYTHIYSHHNRLYYDLSLELSSLLIIPKEKPLQESYTGVLLLLLCSQYTLWRFFLWAFANNKPNSKDRP